MVKQITGIDEYVIVCGPTGKINLFLSICTIFVIPLFHNVYDLFLYIVFLIGESA